MLAPSGPVPIGVGVDGDSPSPVGLVGIVGDIPPLVGVVIDDDVPSPVGVGDVLLFVVVEGVIGDVLGEGFEEIDVTLLAIVVEAGVNNLPDIFNGMLILELFPVINASNAFKASSALACGVESEVKFEEFPKELISANNISILF